MDTVSETTISEEIKMNIMDCDSASSAQMDINASI